MSCSFQRIRRLVRCSIGGFTALLVISAYAAAEPIVKPVAEGVTLIQEVKNGSEAPIVYTAVKVDLTKQGVRVESALGGDTVIEDDSTKGRETVSSFVKRKGVLAGVNADFFPFTGDPLGMAVINSEFVSEPWDGRAVFGIRKDGKTVIDRLSFAGEITASNGLMYKLHGLNRSRGKDEAVLYAPVFGTNTRTEASGVEMVLTDMELPLKVNKSISAKVESITSDTKASPIPAGKLVLSASGKAGEWAVANIREGDTITIKPFIKSYNNVSWDDVEQAVGGAGWLLRNGVVNLNLEEEKLQSSFSTTRHPRTGVGVTAAGEILFVVADGRQTISRGMSLPEFAELMKNLGAVDALNLDGGGSSALSVKGVVVNSPSGGAERPVANMMSIIADLPQVQTVPLKFSTDQLTVQSGCVQALSLVDADTGSPLTPEQMANVVWGCTGGIGLVDQNGVFRGIKANTGTIVAMLGDRTAELPVKVEPGPAVKLTASLDKDETGASNRGQVTASVTDANGNAPKDARITIKVTGGIPDFPDSLTDKNGKVVFGITWDETIPSDQRVITVSSGSLAPVIIKAK